MTNDSVNPFNFGDLVKKIVKDAKPRPAVLKGRRLAQDALQKQLGERAGRATVASVKVGIVTIETDSSVLFQELEGFQKHNLIDCFRAAGLNVRDVRVKLVPRA